MKSEQGQNFSQYFTGVIKEATGAGAFQREFKRTRKDSGVLAAGLEGATAGIIQIITPVMSRRLREEKEAQVWDDYLFAASVIADGSILGLILLGNPGLIAAIPWKILYNTAVSAVPHRIK